MEMTLNIIVSALLVIIIIMFVIFIRRISKFNTSKQELAQILLDFQGSIQKAEKNINDLKAMGTEVDS